LIRRCGVDGILCELPALRAQKPAPAAVLRQQD
jgi:hypothetical protein